jgi:hypothetical protein
MRCLLAWLLLVLCSESTVLPNAHQYGRNCADRAQGGGLSDYYVVCILTPQDPEHLEHPIYLVVC